VSRGRWQPCRTSPSVARTASRGRFATLTSSHTPKLSSHRHRPPIGLLARAAAPDPAAAIVDIGGGASRLVDDLLVRGYSDTRFSTCPKQRWRNRSCGWEARPAGSPGPRPTSPHRICRALMTSGTTGRSSISGPSLPGKPPTSSRCGRARRPAPPSSRQRSRWLVPTNAAACRCSATVRRHWRRVSDRNSDLRKKPRKRTRPHGNPSSASDVPATGLSVSLPRPEQKRPPQ